MSQIKLNNNIGTNKYSCLHIGLPKTATTTLQHLLFSKHPQIEYLGKTYNNRHFKNHAIKKMIAPLTKKRLSDDQLRKRRNMFLKFNNESISISSFSIS